ncbi:hypothetical protein ScPMuIL_010932 [Solemya velum]
MAGFVAKWEFVAVENIDAYMVALGIPENLREMAKTNQPSMEISQDGDTWTIKTTLADKVKESSFKMGEEFDTKTLLGTDIKATITLEGDKMVETQKVGDSEVKIVREVSGDELTTNMTVNGVTSVAKFKRA